MGRDRASGSGRQGEQTQERDPGAAVAGAVRAGRGRGDPGEVSDPAGGAVACRISSHLGWVFELLFSF